MGEQPFIITLSDYSYFEELFLERFCPIFVDSLHNIGLLEDMKILLSIFYQLTIIKVFLRKF